VKKYKKELRCLLMKIIKKIMQVFINILLVLVTLLILFLVYRIVSIKFFNKDITLRYTFYEIATGSMEPTLNVKDFIIVKESDKYSVGDIITYKEDNSYITHRIIKINGDTLVTKGDANNSEDKIISKSEVIGKVVKIIPKGGVIKEIILTPKIIFTLLVTLVLINLCFSLTKKEDKRAIKLNKDENIEIIDLY
jgi:signal peptidase I